MTGLVLELQGKIITGNMSASAIARAALAISSKLEQRQIEEWLRAEVFGYEDAALKTPKYREVRLEPQFLNPSRGWCPIVIQDREFSEIYKSATLIQPLGEIEKLLASDSDCAQITYTQDLEELIHVQLPQPFKVRGKLSKSFLNRICEHVQNTILDWLLELERKSVTGSGMRFSEDEKQAASQTSQVVYAHNVGVIASSHDHSRQNFALNQSIDLIKIEKLAEQLKPLLENIPEPERSLVSSNLEDAIDAARVGDTTRARSILDTTKRIAEGVSGNAIAAGIVHLIGTLFS